MFSMGTELGWHGGRGDTNSIGVVYGMTVGGAWVLLIAEAGEGCTNPW